MSKKQKPKIKREVVWQDKDTSGISYRVVKMTYENESTYFYDERSSTDAMGKKIWIPWEPQP